MKTYVPAIPNEAVDRFDHPHMVCQSTADDLVEVARVVFLVGEVVLGDFSKMDLPADNQD